MAVCQSSHTEPGIPLSIGASPRGLIRTPLRYERPAHESGQRVAPGIARTTNTSSRVARHTTIQRGPGNDAGNARRRAAVHDREGVRPRWEFIIVRNPAMRARTPPPSPPPDPMSEREASGATYDGSRPRQGTRCMSKPTHDRMVTMRTQREWGETPVRPRHVFWVLLVMTAVLYGAIIASSKPNTTHVDGGTECHQTVYVNGHAYVDDYLVGTGVSCP